MIQPKNTARYGAAKEAVLEMLRTGNIGNGEGGNKLPSEGELAGLIGVSTGTIREALRILEMEGIVSKKHGTGNFYHPSALDLKMRIDLMPDFKELLEDAGFSVKREQGNFQFRKPTEREQSIFVLHEEVLSFELTYTADGTSAIQTVNLVPRRFLTAGIEEIKKDGNLMELLWRHCREKIANSIEELVPRPATRQETELFGLESPVAIIALNEIFYSYKDTPIGYATVAFNPKIMKLHLLRKWS